MKFTVTMKDPDTLRDAIREAVKDNLQSIVGLDEDEREQLVGSRTEAIDDLCGRWFAHGEYLTVEIDTEARTCIVMEKRR